jgi:nucleotide-binding universal stress UspA family protein
MYAKILVANDGSVGGQKALTAAIELARQISAELHMVAVEELPRIPASIDEVVEEKAEANHRFAPVTEAAEAQARAAGVTIEIHLMPGHVVESIVRLINERVRLARRRLYGPLTALRTNHRGYHGPARAPGALQRVGRQVVRVV